MKDKKKILIIDDEVDITTVFRILLQSNDFMVDVYNDPISALFNYKPDYYDLLLVDLKMPNLSGFELYKKIRKVDDKTKISFLTANEKYYEQYQEEEFSRLNRELFIQKPIDNKDLLQRINTIIES